MSGPMTESQMPAGVREFREKLRAFDLAVAEWLGLDTSKVMRLELVEDSKIPEFYSMVKWEALEPQSPRVGLPGQTGVVRRALDFDVTIFLEARYLEYDDGRALYATVGPIPSMHTPQEEARLRAAFPART